MNWWIRLGVRFFVLAVDEDSLSLATESEVLVIPTTMISSVVSGQSILTDYTSSSRKNSLHGLYIAFCESENQFKFLNKIIQAQRKALRERRSSHRQ